MQKRSDLNVSLNIKLICILTCFPYSLQLSKVKNMVPKITVKLIDLRTGGTAQVVVHLSSNPSTTKKINRFGLGKTTEEGTSDGYLLLEIMM
jgi:hypothetical protein